MACVEGVHSVALSRKVRRGGWKFQPPRLTFYGGFYWLFTIGAPAGWQLILELVELNSFLISVAIALVITEPILSRGSVEA